MDLALDLNRLCSPQPSPPGPYLWSARRQMLKQLDSPVSSALGMPGLSGFPLPATCCFWLPYRHSPGWRFQPPSRSSRNPGSRKAGPQGLQSTGRGPEKSFAGFAVSFPFCPDFLCPHFRSGDLLLWGSHQPTVTHTLTQGVKCHLFGLLVHGLAYYFWNVHSVYPSEVITA